MHEDEFVDHLALTYNWKFNLKINLIFKYYVNILFGIVF